VPKYLIAGYFGIFSLQRNLDRHLGDVYAKAEKEPKAIFLQTSA
jgi:hypothetical protein